MICFSIFVVLSVWVFARTDATEPSDFLVAKWRARFHAIDDNHDNVLSNVDANVISQHFQESHNITRGQAAAARIAIRSWWTDCIQQGHAPMLEQEFVDGYIQMYSADPEAFKTFTTRCYTRIVGVFDENDDNAISEREFLIFTQSFDHMDVDRNNAIFQSMEPVDGKTTIENFVAHYVAFVCDKEDKQIMA